MKVGLLGFPQSGCTTLFEALSGGQAREGVASVPIPDPRLDALARLAGAKKVVPAALEWHDDLPPWYPDKPETVRQTLSVARQMDALVLVLRAFESPYAPYHAPVDPIRDLQFWLDEFALSDLQVIENRLERLKKLFQSHKESALDKAEAVVLERMAAQIHETGVSEGVEIPKELEGRMRGYGLLTRKPCVIALNLNESALGNESAVLEPLQKLTQLPMVSLCATFERDLTLLPEGERAEFLQMVGLETPRLPTLVQAVYRQLHVQVFYTVGADTRAWLLPIGGTALDAAGVIHSDIARGFIRAEVCHADEVIAAGGWHNAQKTHKVRLEGKDYPMRDGDVIHVRFNL
jgi:ribosome-binding ATPase YchF (GTP1/OBG family)